MVSSVMYKNAGVDIAAGDELVYRIKKNFHSIGGFGGIFNIKDSKYSLVSSTDGVGTKLKLAFLLNKHDTIGIDLVAMNVNDIICLGAKPLFFLDYFSCGKLNINLAEQVINGIALGCKLANIQLIGGETAEMPGFYKNGEYDLAGFTVGIIEKNNIINGNEIKNGDIVIGLASSGPHSNGYSMIRSILSEDEIKQYRNQLLVPTTIYVNPVLHIIQKFNKEIKKVVGIAHITGGSFKNKIKRILPNNVSVVIDKNSWEIPEIFSLLQRKGNIIDEDMYKVFNMGIGMVIIAQANIVDKVISSLKLLSFNANIIGHIEKGDRNVKIL
ncbi:MAG: phosphoribosylformylglycinamidine cyclo-ligase [Endomicrobium sp.]|nr:phosphoribosylformylglycinamidine cyclo-ligase [Endomicrobium sp.]